MNAPLPPSGSGAFFISELHNLIATTMIRNMNSTAITANLIQPGDYVIGYRKDGISGKFINVDETVSKVETMADGRIILLTFPTSPNRSTFTLQLWAIQPVYIEDQN